LCADQASRRLDDLKRRDRWFGARWAFAAREKVAGWVGVEHTWGKLTAVAGCLGLAFLLFGRMEYRVEAPFILRCEEIRFVPAPFDAYIDEVRVEKGQPVREGETLLTLDNRELLLDEAAALADQTRFLQEAEKARAENALALMRIALARAEQARTRLDLVRHRLEQAVVKAPFDGVVVEGDLKERVGAPVEQGQLLLKVARLEDMYAELSVKERDIHEVQEGGEGRMAFASQPQLRFPVRVTRIEPAGQTKEEGNIFIVRCAFPGQVEPWWRPGMSGVAKVNAGKRSPLWIATHRTVDFLLLRFW
jgi:multidrug efflux pump subunit AcrA (membrane-fusion protein)